MFSMGSYPAQPIFSLNRVRELPNYFSQYMFVVTNKHYDKMKFKKIFDKEMNLSYNTFCSRHNSI